VSLKILVDVKFTKKRMISRASLTSDYLEVFEAKVFTLVNEEAKNTISERVVIDGPESLGGR
jgi:hypothetical protein